MVRRGSSPGAWARCGLQSAHQVLPLGRGEVTERAGDLYVRLTVRRFSIEYGAAVGTPGRNPPWSSAGSIDRLTITAAGRTRKDACPTLPGSLATSAHAAKSWAPCRGGKTVRIANAA